MSISTKDLIGEMYSRQLLLTWKRDKSEGWTLASGLWSPFYFMFRHIPFYPDLFEYSINILAEQVRKIQATNHIDSLIGLATTGIPLAAGVALKLEIPLGFTRKLAGVSSLDDLDTQRGKWGQHSLVEGAFKDNMSYLMIDDVVTGGESKVLARKQVDIFAKTENLNLVCAGTAVVVDRGYPAFTSSELSLHSAVRLYDDLEQLLHYGGSLHEVLVIKKYLESPAEFQKSENRTELLSAHQG